MVTPVNPDKVIQATTDRVAQSNPTPSAAASHSQAVEAETAGAAAGETPPQVDDALQLYRLEANSNRTLGAAVETPEQARNLLDGILQQMADAPEKLLQAQAAGVSGAVTNLLELAPA